MGEFLFFYLVPVPIFVPVLAPIPVPIPYPVLAPVPVPVPVPVSVPVPVPVPVPFPVPVPVPVPIPLSVFPCSLSSCPVTLTPFTRDYRITRCFPSHVYSEEVSICY